MSTQRHSTVAFVNWHPVSKIAAFWAVALLLCLILNAAWRRGLFHRLIPAWIPKSWMSGKVWATRVWIVLCGCFALFGVANSIGAMPPILLSHPAIFWSLVLIATALGTWFLRRLELHRQDLATRAAQGLCPCCGYDLRATPERCPECGTAVDEADRPWCPTSFIRAAETVNALHMLWFLVGEDEHRQLRTIRILAHMVGAPIGESPASPGIQAIPLCEEAAGVCLHARRDDVVALPKTSDSSVLCALVILLNGQQQPAAEGAELSAVLVMIVRTVGIRDAEDRLQTARQLLVDDEGTPS